MFERVNKCVIIKRVIECVLGMYVSLLDRYVSWTQLGGEGINPCPCPCR